MQGVVVRGVFVLEQRYLLFPEQHTRLLLVQVVLLELIVRLALEVTAEILF
jgi:hypothetical protein